MGEQIEAIITDRVTPSYVKKGRVQNALHKLTSLLESLSRKYEMDLQVRVVGSVAKDTYIYPPDIDVFILFDPSVARKEMERIGLEIGRKALNGEERYAEHPYIHGRYLGFEVDVVPCYAVQSTSHLLSAVDRTPFHTNLVIGRLEPWQRDQVRLLKQFLKGIGVYGAEAKVEGFSGYLVELLILRYGSFRQVVEAASKWHEGTVLYLDSPGHRTFETPLTFIDPVDEKRNVASALSSQCFAMFVHACRSYLEAPSELFFFPEPRSPMSRGRLAKELERRGTRLLAVRLRRPGLIDDNLYPQVRKTLEGMCGILKSHDFTPLNKGYCVKGRFIYLMVELQADELPMARKHVGPPVTSENSMRFLEKWQKAGITPPFIEGGRWVVMAPRQYRTARALVSSEMGKASLGSAFRQLEGMEVLAHDRWLRDGPVGVTSMLLDRRLPWDR